MIGIWTDSLESDSLGGPEIALRRLLESTFMQDRRNEVLLLHCNSNPEKEIFERYPDKVISKTPKGKLDANLDVDAVLLNGFPNSLPGTVFHSYPSDVELTVWCHGTLPWYHNYAIGKSSSNLPLLENFERARRKFFIRLNARRVDNIITNSPFTRRFIANQMAPNIDDISVAELGVNPEVFHEHHPDEIEQVLSQYGIEESYLFHAVSNVRAKTPESVIRAFKRVRDAGYDCVLVIAGREYPESSVHSVASELGVDDAIYPVGFVDEKTLTALYSGARAFIYPTYHETFGMPVLESMACGTPVVSTNHMAVPDVTAGSAELIDHPEDDKAISNAVCNLFSDDKLWSSYRESAIERAQELSWEETAKNVYSSIRDSQGRDS